MGAAEPLIANARMYAVSSALEAAWRDLFAWVADRAGVALAYRPHPPPCPLEALWAAPRLGCAFMCGYPFATFLPRRRLLAAPLPAPARYGGRPVYVTDFLARRDSGFRGLADAFGTRLGWTVAHSHSGFNAPRHHLLGYRGPGRTRLFAESVGPLPTPAAVIAALHEGRIDVGPLDGYVHDLLARHAPARLEGLVVLESTVPAPIPPLVAAAGIDEAACRRLRRALLAVGGSPETAALRATLRLDGFAAVAPADYAELRRRAQAAYAAGYPRPG